MSDALHVAWYRTRATFGKCWPGYLSIVVLVGLVGGLAMGSLAAARRTASSFSVFWASTNPSALYGATGILNPQLPWTPYDQRNIDELSRLPHVKNVETQSGLNILPLQADGAPRQDVPQFSPGPGNGYASVNGLYFNQDKVAVLKGRMANPANAGQFMLSAPEAQSMGLQVGDVVRFGIYTNAQIGLPDFGSPRLKPFRVVEEKLVGIVAFNTAVIEDQSDEEQAPDNLFTPALTRPFLKCCVNYSQTGLQVTGGNRFVPTVISEIDRLFPSDGPQFQALSPTVEPRAQRAIKPEAIALAAFGCIVALACLLLAVQLIGRQLRLRADEREVLRALGSSPGQTVSDGVIGILASVVTGTALAVGLAVAFSPIAPLGPVRSVFPHPGLNFDWTVLGLGSLVLVSGLTLATLALSYLGAPHRAVGRPLRSYQQPSRVVAATAAAGLPAPAVTGVRFALVPGSGRTSVPVRSAVLGTVLALIVLIATVTFGASLGSLVSHPALYGWNWDYLLAAGGDLPGQEVTSLLDHDAYVSAWSGIYTALLPIDGQEVPVLGEAPDSRVAPALLSGHELATAHEVVLGPVTLAQLHKKLGQTVVLTSGGLLPPQHLQVVGTATLPAFGQSGQHLEMGVGAVVASQLIPAVQRNQFDNPLPGPQDALVRLRPGLRRGPAYRSLVRIAAATSNPQNFGVSVVGVQRPAEILNYRSLGTTPAYLGAGLAAGAVAALAMTLVASVRRRRRDLAVLKVLGFTNNQVAATVAWHSTVSVVIGVIAGVPLGIALGRWLWDLFARDINAVPQPSVPVLQVVLIAAGALLVANIVAALPGRFAARTPVALVLRSE